MELATRLQTIGSTLYSPVRRLKHLVKSPSLASPDIMTLDICWNQIFRDQIYRHDNFVVREKGAILFDVGANVGVFAAWAAQHYRPAQIFCFEPDPVTYPYLLRNARATARVSPLTEIVPLQLAVSTAAGQTLTLYHSPRLCGASTVMALGKELGWESHDVSTTTISRELHDRKIDQVDLLKIDVEGHAAEVLKGVDDRDFPRIRNIVLECDYLPQGSTPADVVRGFLADRGYETAFDDPTLTNNLTLYAWRA